MAEVLVAEELERLVPDVVVRVIRAEQPVDLSLPACNAQLLVESGYPAVAIDHIVDEERRAARVLPVGHAEACIGGQRRERDLLSHPVVVPPTQLVKRRIACVGKRRVGVGPQRRPIRCAGLVDHWEREQPRNGERRYRYRWVDELGREAVGAVVGRGKGQPGYELCLWVPFERGTALKLADPTQLITRTRDALLP